MEILTIHWLSYTQLFKCVLFVHAHSVIFKNIDLGISIYTNVLVHSQACTVTLEGVCKLAKTKKLPG